MSSALALASVTAVLKSLLENGLVDRGVLSRIGGDVVVSALTPDRIAVGAEERAQLNLFLYQVTPSTGLRSPARLAVSAMSGADPRPSGPPPALALELHYLLTAYGAQDLQIEILLGHALQLLQEMPVLTEPVIRRALAAVSSSEEGRVVPPELAALASSDLAECMEQIKICPQFLNSEELSKIWSTLQARYRPSMAYKVSAVFIEGIQGERRQS